ncbi:hypothetical protein L484_012538 [Morus notabilis]|uniref:Uncharacterized protein n=1 Tax=Morus notabilis TaxID=981085 RepID=W9QCM3_9ROSA|nr:uncharacterized protein LOC21395746 [Morus notabilis]EXB26549.1 hypothetical protein L484_012538 [Morus notabilis]
MEPSTPPQDLEEYSASSTTIVFDRLVPLLRGPVRSGPGDDPSAGPYVLAFRDARAWRNAYRACESKIAEQCEAGARIGCAMTASSKCKPPWWRSLSGFKVSDLKEREECEEREMEGCLAAAKDKCGGFARERCVKSFRDARIAARVGGLSPKQAEKLVCWTIMADKSLWIDLVGFKRLVRLGLSDREFGATNYRACELLGSSTDVDSILGGASEVVRF